MSLAEIILLLAALINLGLYLRANNKLNVLRADVWAITRHLRDRP